MNELFWDDFWSNHGGTTGEFLQRGASDPVDGAFGGLDDECDEIIASEARVILATDEWCRRTLRSAEDEASCGSQP